MALFKLLQPTLAARIDLEAAAFVFAQSMIWLGSHAHYIMPCIFVLWLAYCVVEKSRLNVSPKPKAMKTKTTLAALLLAAVMVTPSYGADQILLDGAEDIYQNKNNTPSAQYFCGYVNGVVSQNRYTHLPPGVTMQQLWKQVANFIHNHPEEHSYYDWVIVKKATKRPWPVENNVGSK